VNSRDRHIKKEPTDLLLWMFFSFIGVLTLFNPKGHTPIPLLIAMGISFTLFAKFALKPRVAVPVVAEDIFLILFLFVSSFSVAVNSHRNEMNLNHLLGEFTIIGFYYFVLKFAVFNSKYFVQENKFYGGILAGAIILSASGVIDYFLLINGINVATILPMEEANRIAGSGIFTRARSFLPEPTEYALGLNALFPIVLVRVWERNYRILGFALGILYLFSLVTTFSAGGIVSVGISVAATYLFYILMSGAKASRKLKILVGGGVVVIGMYLWFEVVYRGFIAEALIPKITLSPKMKSSMARLAAYERGFGQFDGGIWPVLVGRGTGFFSKLGEGSTHNWWLTIITEKGFLGFGSMVFLLYFAFARILRIRSRIKYGMLVSLLSMCLHYNLLTGFYYPFFWLVLVSLQYQYFRERRYELVGVSGGPVSSAAG